MNVLSVIMLTFAVIGAVDYLFGCKCGIGKEFEKGIMFLGTLTLCMAGMLIIAPYLAVYLRPLFAAFSDAAHIDASVFVAMIFANDMGGAALAKEVGSGDIALFNGLVVGSMMGATLSFTLSYSISTVKKELHGDMFLGFTCGIITIPVGCIVGGLIYGFPIGTLLWNMLPLILFCLLIAALLTFCPKICIKTLAVLGYLVKALIVVGLIVGIVKHVTGKNFLAGTLPLADAMAICIDTSVMLAGAFPFIYTVTKVFGKYIRAVGAKIGINEYASVGFLSSLATSATTYGIMDKMDKKGVVYNSAFAISAAWLLADHMAYTIAFDKSFLAPVMVGKAVSGISAVLLSAVVLKKRAGKQ